MLAARTEGERDHLLSEASETIRDTILKMPKASRKQQLVLGYDFLDQAAEQFIRSCPKKHMRILAADPRFRCFSDVVGAPWPWSKDRLAA